MTSYYEEMFNLFSIKKIYDSRNYTYDIYMVIYLVLVCVLVEYPFHIFGLIIIKDNLIKNTNNSQIIATSMELIYIMIFINISKIQKLNI
jgi:hypothetical protein